MHCMHNTCTSTQGLLGLQLYNRIPCSRYSDPFTQYLSCVRACGDLTKVEIEENITAWSQKLWLVIKVLAIYIYNY